MVRDKNSINNVLHSADIDIILESYSDILQSYQNFQEKNSIYGSFKKTKRKLEVLFPLKEHQFHGITGIHAIEKYDEAKYVTITTIS